MKGVYILIIEVKENIQKKIGRLGNIKFDKGDYIYVGSAQNGIEKRIGRHLKKRKKKFWHIDHILSDKNVVVSGIYYKKSKKEEECNLAEKILKHSEPVLGFGCSDCSCKSHLFKVNLSEIRRSFENENLSGLYSLFFKTGT